MSKYYIGNRLSHAVMSAVLSIPSVPYLNRGMSAQLATVAMKMGIKKTQQGKGITFWSVDQEQMEFLTAESSQTFITLKTGEQWNPLLVVDADLMVAKMRVVNEKYGRSFSRDLARQYDRDLQNAVAESVQKLNEDVKIAKPKGSNTYNIKVGDVIPATVGHRSYSCGKVTKVTDSGYEVQAWVPRHIIWYYARVLGMDIDGHDGQNGKDSYMGRFNFPIEGHGEDFTMSKPKRFKFSAKYEHRNPKALVEGDPGYMVYSDSWDMGD